MKRIFALVLALSLALLCLAPAMAEETEKTRRDHARGFPEGPDDHGPCQADAGR